MTKPTNAKLEGHIRVLVIDDEASFTKMVKLNLEATGRHIVRTVNESPKAIEAAREFRPHVILLDVVMPEQDGGDVANNLRTRTATKNIPIIFVFAMVSQRGSRSGFYESGRTLPRQACIHRDTLHCDQHRIGRGL